MGNPHNVTEWYKYLNIFDHNPIKQIAIYSKAICSIDLSKATGKPHTLWTSCARLYEYYNEPLNSRTIFKKAVTEEFPLLDDLVQVYCDWVEMELRQNRY